MEPASIRCAHREEAIAAAAKSKRLAKLCINAEEISKKMLNFGWTDYDERGFASFFGRILYQSYRMYRPLHRNLRSALERRALVDVCVCLEMWYLPQLAF